MDKRKTLKQIEGHFDKASELAIELVESEARKILRSHTNLNEFIMGMGSAFFTDKNGNIDNWKYKYLQEFSDFVDDLDEKFKVSGCLMRFTVNSKAQHDW